MYKAVIGSLRLALGLGLLGSVVWQVTDRLANNVFRPGEYFAYFSIVSSIVAGGLALYSAYVLFADKEETKFHNIARLSLTAAMVIVGVVYHALLADAAGDIRDGGYVWPVLPNQIIHTYAPILIVVDYLVSLRSPKLRLRASLWVAVFPLAWLGFSVVRGLITNWWPYWFINPNEEGGVPGMLTYVAAITVFFFAVGYLLQSIRLTFSKVIAS